MQTIGQIIGFGFSCFLLRLAFKFFRKEKWTQCVFAMWAGAFVLLCSFSWFQGWAKAFIASNIRSQLATLSQQVNTVEAATTDMHTQLETHQTEIDKHQKELGEVQAKIRVAESNVFNQQSDITNQFQQISKMQSGLNGAQTNLDAQQKKLSDVEYWVRNISDNTITETFSINDTNHLVFCNATNDAVTYIARLTYSPIKNSVEVGIKNDLGVENREFLPENFFAHNLCGGRLVKYNTNTVKLKFHYLKDTRDKDVYEYMPDVNRCVITDGDKTTFYPKPNLPK